MALSTLPVLSPTDATLKILFRPDFPRVLDAAIDHALFRHLDHIFGSCCYDRCQAQAEISELETGIGYCLHHFQIQEKEN